MVKYSAVLICIALVFSINCNNSRPTESSAEALVVTLPQRVQKVYCHVDFGTMESEIVKNRTFLINNGLNPNIDEFPENPDWKALEEVFLQTDLSQMTTAESQLLQQVAAILILRNHALLEAPDERSKIAVYAKKYVDAGGSSAGLLYFCLNALRDEIEPDSKKNYIETVHKRSEEVMRSFQNWLDRTESTMSQEGMPPEMVEALRQDMERLEKIIATERLFREQLAKN